MWNFFLIRLKQFTDFPAEWCVRITDISTLMLYIVETQPGMVRQAFLDQAERLQTGATHYGPGIGALVRIRCECMGQSVVEAICGIMEDRIVGMEKVIRSGDILYVRANGSYTMDKPDACMYDTLDYVQRTSLQWMWNRDKVRIAQWPGGQHWYASIDGVSISMRGRDKWNTYEGASQAMDEFFKLSYGK